MFESRKLNAALDAEITVALAELETQRDNPEKYNATMERIANLEGLKSTTSIKPPTMDTVLIVGANLFGILWLARFERDDVIKAPNAFRNVIKPRTPAG